jgi:hypothetical protein
MEEQRTMRTSQFPMDDGEDVEGGEAQAALQWTRRELLRRGAYAAAAVGVALGATLLPGGGAITAQARSRRKRHATPRPAPPPTYHGPYFHAAFTVNTPAEVEQAASLGITHIINYVGSSWSSADLTSPLGQALARHGMKTFLNVENPFLSCSAGQGHVDVARLRALVGQFYQSPLLAGYWTKDDDCGSEADAVRQIYHEIRSIDPDPKHLIMPGFGDAGSVNRNYAPGQADLLAFYPYPVYSRGPAYEVPRMLNIVRSRTPHGQQPPPFIGIYQAFARPPRRPVPSRSNILNQVYTFVRYGAAGVGAFGWESDNDTHVIGNDPSLRHAVAAVSSYLRGH